MFRISKGSFLWAISSLFLISSGAFAQQSKDALLQRYSQQAQAAMAARQYSNAAEAYEKMIKLEPGVAELYANLGLAYFQMGKFQQAIPAFEKALKLKPGLQNPKYFLAMANSELGHNQQALPELAKGFSQTHNAMLKRMLGLYLERTYTGLHRDRDAVAVALQMAGLFPNDPEVLYHTGRLCGNFAFLSMQRLQQVAPASLWRHLASGELFESQGDDALAIREYRSVLALDPHRPGIHFRLGRALLHSKQPGSRAEALKEFQQELKVDPTNARAAYEAGEIYRQSGQFSEAHALFTEALKHYPNFEDAHVGLGRVLLNEKEPDQALAHLQKAVSLDPEDDVAYFQLAQAYRQLGNMPEQRKALAAFQRLQAKEQEQQQKLAVGSYSADAVTRQKLDSKGP
jgi:tetratricopeptide (TPR) repeat protein